MIMFIFLLNINICLTEIDVLRIPKSQIYYPIYGDIFCLLLEFIYSWSFISRFLQM
jgi:hypothetical protein